MACQEIDQMRKEVCQSLRGNLNTWQYNLQARWGDPNVYASERELMERQDAALAYDLSRRNTTLLQDAYKTRAAKQSEAHKTRMADLKRRGYRSSSRPPQSDTHQHPPRIELHPEQPHREPLQAAAHLPG